MQVFQGTNSKNRFGYLLREAIANLGDVDAQVVGNISDYGTHSIRKGGPTYCLGQVSGPTPVAVNLRMGHSIGHINDKYIYQGEGADQLCGRTIAGLSFNDNSFAVLPPHFDSKAHSELNQGFWRSIVADYDKYPTCFKKVFPYLLASLLFHEQFLRRNLDSRHPLFQARVFANNYLLQQLKQSILTGIGKCPNTGMIATGIPPHLAIAAEMDQLRNKLTHLEEEVNALPVKTAQVVDAELRKEFVINGVAPLTAAMVDEKLAKLQTIVLDSQQSLIAAIGKSNTPTSSVSSQQDATHEWSAFNWNDGLLCHFVPKGFRLPSNLSLRLAWDLWYCGQKNYNGVQGQNIRPYRLLSRKFDICSEDDVQYTRIKCCIQQLEEMSGQQHLISDHQNICSHISSLSADERDELFRKCYNILIKSVHDKCEIQIRRPYDLSIWMCNVTRHFHITYTRHETIIIVHSKLLV